MPTLNIAGKRVNVGDEFLSMTPEQQSASVDEIARSIGLVGRQEQPSVGRRGGTGGNFFDQFDPPAQRVSGGNFFDQFDAPAKPNTSGFSDDLKKLTPQPRQVEGWRSAAIGATQGALAGFGDELAGLAEASGLPVGTPPIISYPVGAYRKLTGAPGADDAYTAARDGFRTEQAAAEAQHPYLSTGGQLAGALAGAAIPASRIGTGASLAGNMGRGLALGAGLGAVQGAGDAPEASDIPTEALWGAGVGGAIGAAVPALAQGARRIVSPFTISAEKRAAADLLRSEGVTDVTAGQRLGRDQLRRFESEMGGGAAQRISDRQSEQFTRAALRRAGIDADRATPDVMDAAFDRIGQAFDNFGTTANIQPSRKLGADLLRALTDYKSITGESTRAPLIENAVADLAQHAQQNGGTISGKFYAAMRSDLARKGRGTANPELKQAINDVVSALDDAMEKSVNPADAAAYRTARKEYRNILVLEKAAGGAGEQTAEGIITPAKLRSAVQQQDKRAYVRGKGDFAELSRAGEMLLKPLPSSGTAQFLRAQGVSHAVTGGIGAALGAREGGSEGAGLGAIAGVAAPRLAARAVLSPIGQRYLTNQLAPGSGGLYAPLANLLAQPVRGHLEAR